MSSRLAAGWAQAEGPISRLLLIAVFVISLMAQFVQLVDAALQDKAYIGGALLAVVGYLLYAEVQRLNAASTARRENKRPWHARCSSWTGACST
ncbi:hypothetical protein [Streptomyces chartreusis]|uniref:hypothetical protein n=1 Tax=Streptomyces chartreusis TaxID=1969 RepID=UPI0036551D5C